MNTFYYNIHNKILFDWTNPLFSPVKSFSIKFHYFQTNKKSYLNNDTKYKLSVINGEPPSDIKETVNYASERFGIGNNTIHLLHQHGIMKFKSWVIGLDDNHTVIYYKFPTKYRLKFPWFFFPDYLVCMHVLEPVIEYKLLQQDCVVLHAAALAKNNYSIILAGRGGVKKTTYVMRLLQEGWNYLADDKVILYNKNLYCYPLCDTFFDYFFLHKNDESLGVITKFKALNHVIKCKPLSFPITNNAKVQYCNLLLGWNNIVSQVIKSGKVSNDFVSKLTAQDKLERLNYVDVDEAQGRFMLQLAQAKGIDSWNLFWRKHHNLILNNLSGLNYRIIYSGKNIALENLLTRNF